MSGPGLFEHNSLIRFVAEVLTLTEDVLTVPVEEFVRNLRLANEALVEHSGFCAELRDSRKRAHEALVKQLKKDLTEDDVPSPLPSPDE